MSLKFRSEKQPLIIYHANCLDGFTAAYVTYNALVKLGSEPILLPDTYNTGLVSKPFSEWPTSVAGRDIYIVDFSYPAQMLKDLCDQANDVTVLDHHESAIKKLKEGFPDLASMPENLTLILDNDLSGAGLAWLHFNCFDPIPPIVRYVQDRDLWRFEFPETKAYCAALINRKQSIEAYTSIDNKEATKLLISEGSALLIAQETQLHSLCRNMRDIIINGWTVPTVNCPAHLVSELGSKIMSEYAPPFVAMYYDGATHRHWSLRSTSEAVAVSGIAETFKGGGHRNAAGFVTELNFMFPCPPSIFD